MATKTRDYRVTAVEPRDGYSIWVRYADGVEGSVDLSHMADWKACAKWADRSFFESVAITEEGAVAWVDGDYIVDLCPETMYMRLTGEI
ncbi:MAG: DUF2442 domain-containing protein [Chloroflexota bacterium]|nr:DUF2442 domain-containing protein [Chloroflexota bacterium]